MAMKQTNDGTKDTWHDQNADDMSAPLKAKWDAWRKAVSAERDAKKALDDTGGALARRAKIIGTNQYACYGMGRGGSSGFYAKDIGAAGGAAKAKKPGVKF